MFSKLHDRLGTAGLVVAIVALVAALTGSAFAAAGLNGKQKKEVKSIAKTEAKKFAKEGPAGPKGDTGATGPAGARGSDGTNGTNGTAGVSPVGSNFSGSKSVGSVTCTEGGIEYKGTSTNLVCNGKKGTTGFTETLPSGQTETGTFGGTIPPSLEGFFPIPFAIPLSTTPDPVFVGKEQAEKEQGEDEGCPGVVGGVPSAEEGKLCVYLATSTGNAAFGAFFEPSAELELGAEAGPAGSIVAFTNGASEAIVYGTWAVTAE